MPRTKHVRDVSKAEAARQKILAHIVGGRFAPGARLPSFAQLEHDYSAGRAVLQQALASLKRDGFVRSVNRQGLFLVSTPPHLHRYGVVMAPSPGDSGWTQLMGAITEEAHQIERRDPHAEFVFYHGIDNKETCEKTIHQLAVEMRAQRFAGLIMAPNTFRILDHADLAQLHIPRVYLWARDTTGLTPRIGVDSNQLLKRALELLARKGRRRIAIVHMAETTFQIDHNALFAEAGLKFHRPWLQHIGRSHPECAADVAMLLVDSPSDSRPDGLIIADDSLAQPMSRGLLASGVRVGKELDIVAHCNWPWPVDSVLPMTRIGFDMRQIMRRAMDAIRMQREGTTPPPTFRAPALFEDEVDREQPQNS